MRLLLCERSDASAVWALRALHARGLAIELVTSRELAEASGWEHRVGGDEPASTRIELADGRRLESWRTDAVLNRLVLAPRPRGRADRRVVEYATQELWALWTSWLASLPEPVLGRPAPYSLSGPWLQRSQWMFLAARSGLRTVLWRSGLADDPEIPVATLFVVMGAVVGPRAPPEIVAGVQALARAAGATVLGVEFGAAWTFSGATPLPDLRRGGEPLVDVLLQRMAGA